MINKLIHRLSALILTAFILIALNSCGLMFGGSRYTAYISSANNPNALIYANGQPIGKGNAMGYFERKLPLVVELQQEGCSTASYIFHRRFRTENFILSVLCWGIPGALVDLATGAAYKPDHINNPNVKQFSNRHFVFMVDIPNCPE